MRGSEVPRARWAPPRGPVLATNGPEPLSDRPHPWVRAPSSRRAALRQGRPPPGHQGDPPFSRPISTVLTTNKYRSRGGGGARGRGRWGRGRRADSGPACSCWLAPTESCPRPRAGRCPPRPLPWSPESCPRPGAGHQHQLVPGSGWPHRMAESGRRGGGLVPGSGWPHRVAESGRRGGGRPRDPAGRHRVAESVKNLLLCPRRAWSALGNAEALLTT